MRTEEKLLFGCFEITSYVLIGTAIMLKSPLFAVAGLVLFAITAVWFFRLAKRIGIWLPRFLRK